MLRVVVSSEDTFGEPVFVAQACLPVASIVEGRYSGKGDAMGRALPNTQTKSIVSDKYM
jgi:hypothetical protein